jgi:DNA-binding response OmpR family regulator
VILDRGLPLASGFDVLRELRSVAQIRHTPVIAISGDQERLRLARFSGGASDAIEKPFDPETLARAVDRAARQLHT